MATLIVAGATGAIGRTVVQHAILSPHIGRVLALTRHAAQADTTGPNQLRYDEGLFKKLFGLHLSDAAHAAIEEHKKLEDACRVSQASLEQLNKVEVVTFDWEHFANFWVSQSSAAPAADSESYRKYSEIFSGVDYAAMCLGTTRGDAGSAETFIRCDYDYVLAFSEALLTFSGSRHFCIPDEKDDGASLIVHRIGDGLDVKHKKKVDAKSGGSPPPPPPNTTVVASSKTLRGIAQVSAYNADSSSWFLYMKTKGATDEGVVERVLQHNHSPLREADESADPNAGTTQLSLIRPGLLNRNDKARWNEKLGKVFLSSIDVSVCGKCIVHALLGGCRHCKKLKLPSYITERVQLLSSSPPTEAADKVSAFDIAVYGNAEIKKEASEQL